MSRPIEQLVACPRCGHQASFTCWSSVNVSLDPRLKEQLLYGLLTTFVCSECDYKCPIEYDILDHDMGRPLMIWLKYPEEDGTVSLDPSADQMFDLLESNYRFRLVTSFQDLVEKIRIFDDGFDDVTIETLKLFVCIRELIDITAPFRYDRTEGSFLSGKSLVFAQSLPTEAETKYAVKNTQQVEGIV